MLRRRRPSIRPAKSSPPRARLNLRCEELESRVALSTLPAGGLHPLLVAGAPNGSPPDSPAQRVDANTTTSPYAGVGSVQVNVKPFWIYMGTGTPIDSTHILTAAHVVDINGDGKLDAKDKVQSISFNLNYGGNLTSQIPVTQVAIHPNFTGFARPDVNDDLAILTLAAPLPAGVPIYKLPSADLTAGTTLTLVGYGQSGNGVNGYTVDASLTVKRTGQNVADAFYGQDDRKQPAANEVFRIDFDGPTGKGPLGGPTLGNAVETQLGPGDSGGPSFVDRGGGLEVAGVNTFSQGLQPGRFGAMAGGISVFPYVSWINQVRGVAAAAPGGGSGGKAPGGGTGSSLSTSLNEPVQRDRDSETILLAALRSAPTPRLIVVASLGTGSQAAQFVITPPAPVEAPRAGPAILQRVIGIGGGPASEEEELPEQIPAPQPLRDAAPQTDRGGALPTQRLHAQALLLAIDTFFAEQTAPLPAEEGAGPDAVNFGEHSPVSLAGMSGLAALLAGGMACPSRGVFGDSREEKHRRALPRR